MLCISSPRLALVCTMKISTMPYAPLPTILFCLSEYINLMHIHTLYFLDHIERIATKILIGNQPYFAYGHKIFEFSWYLFLIFVACLKLGHHLCVLHFVRIHVYVRLHHHISCPRIFRSIGRNRYIPPTLQYGRFIISSQAHSDIVPLIQIESTYCDHTRYK